MNKQLFTHQLNLKLNIIDFIKTLKSTQNKKQTMTTPTNPTQKTRVACIGDSITELTNYPNHLQTLLGNAYIVGNFGACGTTISHKSGTAYRYSQAYRQANQFQPNLALIMLGTNDADPTLAAHYENLASDYQQLIEDFKQTLHKPEIWMVLPPPIFSQWGGLSATLLNNQVILAIKQAASCLNLPVIDVHSALCSSELFIDGVHPDATGAERIAETIYKAICLDF